MIPVQEVGALNEIDRGLVSQVATRIQSRLLDDFGSGPDNTLEIEVPEFEGSVRKEVLLRHLADRFRDESNDSTLGSQGWRVHEGRYRHSPSYGSEIPAVTFTLNRNFGWANLDLIPLRKVDLAVKKAYEGEIDAGLERAFFLDQASNDQKFDWDVPKDASWRVIYHIQRAYQEAGWEVYSTGWRSGMPMSLIFKQGDNS